MLVPSVLKNQFYSFSQTVVVPTESVWQVFPNLAAKYKALNLGQGFPNFSPPKFVVNAAKEAMSNPLLNQYTLCAGHPRLVNVLSKQYAAQFGRDKIDPKTEISISCGGTEGLYNAINSILKPKESFVLIEPFYDSYPLAINYAGGKSKFIPLVEQNTQDKKRYSSSWTLDMEELEKIILSDPDYPTRGIIINNPLNPVGKIYSRSELENIALLAKKHDLIVISDEVYDSMVYDNEPFISIASLPGMWERTVTIGSAGKTFSATGWKIGYCFGPENLIRGITQLHLANTFAIATPLQEAVAVGFEAAKAENYFNNHIKDFTERRDLIINGLDNIGMTPIRPQGSYFVLIDTQNWDLPLEDDYYPTDPRDWRLARKLVETHNLVTIPPTAFYSNPHFHFGENYLRLAFCKDLPTIRSAIDCLKNVPLK